MKGVMKARKISFFKIIFSWYKIHIHLQPCLKLFEIFCGLLSFTSQPERILGDEYSIRSELWSLGVSLLEVTDELAIFFHSIT